MSERGDHPTTPERRPLPEGPDWTFDLVEAYEREIGRLAHERYGLDTYPLQIEIIRSDQMIDAYASVGMPVGYHHWSFGKHFVQTEQAYRRGQMGLAYEIVINSNPCIAYLMEENSLPMQALVLAHAGYGHNNFFHDNYLFRTWTDASAIVDYLLFAREYIAECERRHGVEEVERILDSCHALMNHGVDRYKRPYPPSAAEERERQRERMEYQQRRMNDLWRTIPSASEGTGEEDIERFPPEPQENLLYFIEKNAPLLEPWQREVVRIVRKVAQYFYPQRQTQVMNEGWATFWHYTLLNDLYDEDIVTDGFMLEFLQTHTSVLAQPAFDSPHYSGINPYTLGFSIYRDLRRMCEAPDDEDREWFPEIAGSDWLSTLKFAMQNFKDESFVLQFLSPKVIRDLRLFGILDDDRDDAIEVAAIHDSAGYREVRRLLASHYNLGDREPNIQVFNVDVRGDRTLTLRHTRHSRKPLGESTEEMLRHVHRLWGFPVRMEAVEGGEVVEVTACPSE